MLAAEVNVRALACFISESPDRNAATPATVNARRRIGSSLEKKRGFCHGLDSSSV
jgi:hypothetical protein